MARRIAGVVALALLSVLMAATCTAGCDFYVGGRAGWAPNPAEPFNAWAERNRFQVNDTIGMDAAAKICYLELKRDFCGGRNRAALNALCSKRIARTMATRVAACAAM